MNVKEPELSDRFIELRGQGLTFDRISAEIGVHRHTLINWSRKYQHRLRNVRALETEALADQCKVSRRQCVQILGEDLRLIREEVARRNLSDISTARLLTLSALLRAEANRLNGPLHLSESTDAIPPEENQYLQPTIDWEV